MGTTTFFLRHNDLRKPFTKMDKKELEKLDSLSPYGETQHHAGWSVPFELHNGNVYVLVFWKGRLIKIENAPKTLNKKYYSKLFVDIRLSLFAFQYHSILQEAV